MHSTKERRDRGERQRKWKCINFMRLNVLFEFQFERRGERKKKKKSLWVSLSSVALRGVKKVCVSVCVC